MFGNRYNFRRVNSTSRRCEPPKSLGIHIYLLWTKEGDLYHSHSVGDVTAEELCMSVAEAVGTSFAVALVAHHNSLSGFILLKVYVT